MRWLVLLLLAGCASQPIAYAPIKESVAVAVECKIEAIPTPEWPTQALNDKNTLFEKVRAVLAELSLRKGYEAQLEAAVKSCQ